MSAPSSLIIVLAAGKGTRMKSALPKVLHKVAGRSMLGHVLDLASRSDAANVAVVAGPGMDNVAAEAAAIFPGASAFTQQDQRGTADAVLAARPAIEAHTGDVIVLYTDGITEAMDVTGELFTDAALSRVVSTHHALDAGGIRERVLREVSAFVGDAEPHDDMTMVIVKVEETMGQ